ncbi:hypothetical protein JCGZ_08647 [Jatropha curcas]|uniref:Uncharacterized protein n=1 Tax=Jatropha curcas TaxID=180498 RepID=A0A067KN05_JATCU|nr:hypothetical protein JCGZ_08647 [Jatropha curcas]
MANMCSPGKTSWPELLGENGKAAAALIEKENKDLHAIVLKEGTPVTMEFRWDRVRVWVDECGVVILVPING